jgi:hypothetical protein
VKAGCVVWGAPLVLAAALLGGAWAVPSASAAQPPQRGTAWRPLSQFPGLARVFRDLAARANDTPAGRLSDFEQVLIAVTGAPAAGHSFEEYRRAFSGEATLTAPADRGVARRDGAAYKLHSLGYSAREIADLLSGRISRRALDNAQKMLMVGTARERVSDYLDREYRRLAQAREARRGRPGRVPPMPVPNQAAVEGLLARYSTVHGVDQALARAVASVESGWNQQARSGAGAIGVMQLMPGTARELGVDPENVEQNIEGGIRYLAWLLRWFGNVEAALVAYNAGPGFAQRCLRGEAVVYGETRDFVTRVLAAAGR